MIKINIINDFKILHNYNDLRSKNVIRVAIKLISFGLKILNKSISVGLASIILTR